MGREPEAAPNGTSPHWLVAVTSSATSEAASLPLALLEELLETGARITVGVRQVSDLIDTDPTMALNYLKGADEDTFTLERLEQKIRTHLKEKKL